MIKIVLGFKIIEFLSKEGGRQYNDRIDYMDSNDFGRLKAPRGNHRIEDRYAPNSLLPKHESIELFIEVNGLFRKCEIKDISRNGFSLNIHDLILMQHLRLASNEDWFMFGVKIKGRKHPLTASLRHVIDNENYLTPDMDEEIA